MPAAKPSRFWWLRSGKYVAIFLRELTSFFILAYVVLYLFTLSQAHLGKTEFINALSTPPFISLSLLLLVFTLYHSITWFIAIPKVLPLRIGNFVLSSGLGFVVNIVIFIVASLTVASLVFGVKIPFIGG